MRACNGYYLFLEKQNKSKETKNTCFTLPERTAEHIERSHVRMIAKQIRTVIIHKKQCGRVDMWARGGVALPCVHINETARCGMEVKSGGSRAFTLDEHAGSATGKQKQSNRVMDMKFDNYEFRKVYTEDLEAEQYEIVAKDIKCLQKTRSTKAGEMIEIESFPAFLHRVDYSRAKKEYCSTEKQKNLNEKYARRKLVRLINANFTRNDIWGTFGWDFERMPETLDDAQHEVVKWINRINYRRKKNRLKNLKYIYVIESTEGKTEKGEPETKYHVHIVMDGAGDRDEIEKLWKGGAYPQTRRLVIKDFGGLTGLATYISKCPEGRRRWAQSKGLRKWTSKPTESFSRFSKASVEGMGKNREAIKGIMEKEYPGYAYSEDYPAEIKYNQNIGGFYLYCRMYKKQESKKTKGEERKNENIRRNTNRKHRTKNAVPVV